MGLEIGTAKVYSWIIIVLLLVSGFLWVLVGPLFALVESLIVFVVRL